MSQERAARLVTASQSPEAIVLATSATALLEVLHHVLPAGEPRDRAEEHIVAALAAALEALE